MQVTLQSRIITLLIISSLIFISVFTFIQINNQISNTQQDNLYQANLSTLIVKNNLESIIKQAQIENLTDYAPNLQTALVELNEAKVIKEAIIFNREGKIIASTDTGLNQQEVSFKDLNRTEMLEEMRKNNKWFFSEIDKIKQQIDIYIYIGLDAQNLIKYVAKLTYPLGNIQEALFAVYRPVILNTFVIILANIMLGYILSKTIVGPIKVLNEVTKIISGGDLTVRTRIETNDELHELGETFNHMTEQLVIMKERAENANPLTKLPGNIVIHEEVEKRIQTNQKFVVIYCDLDNFKAFNDKYGIAKGDEAIKLTADVFKEAAKAKGNPDDFVGHEGGDDFILLSTPLKAQDVADFITKEFDKRVRVLYSQEDLTQGYIIAHARDGSIKQFPIMTISLAGVSNELKQITSYAEVTNIAAEVKKKAKAIEGSIFVMDKRTT